MKVGDYVGWRDIDGDAPKCPNPAGIIVEVEKSRIIDEPGYARYLILYQHNGKLAWEHGSDLVVINESR